MERIEPEVFIIGENEPNANICVKEEKVCIQADESETTGVVSIPSGEETTNHTNLAESHREIPVFLTEMPSDYEQDVGNQDSTQHDEVESTGEQEVKIEYLAQALAENLHREHPAAHFNFEEFETDEEYQQHQERLQLHLYQQHVLHQQEMHRQHDRARQHLSLNVPDSSRYSSMPSPGSKFFKQPMPPSPSGTVRTERTAQTNTAAWYRAEEAANFVNRAGSPCSRKDRLYEAMPYQYFEKDYLRGKYSPQFPHQPLLISKAPQGGRPDEYTEEQGREGREGFFQRLYETHFDQMSLIDSARRQTDQYITQVGNTVHPRVLTGAERDEVTNRLLFHKEYTNRKFEAQRAGVSNALKERQNGRFADKKSHQLVGQTQRNALSEIFDVLLVTAQMERERNALNSPNTDFLDKDGVPVETGDSSAKQSETTTPLKDVLDTSLAQARFLQPKQLADAIGVILDALNPRSVSRKQFVEFTLHCMNKTYKIEPKQTKQSSPQCGNSPKAPTSETPSAPSQPSPLNMTSHLAVDTPPAVPQHPNPLLFPVHVSSDVDQHAPPRLSQLDITHSVTEEDGPATEAVEYMREPYSPSSSVRVRSRASSPAHTPRANRSSMLRTTLASPSHSAQVSRSSSKQNLLFDRDREGRFLADDQDTESLIVPASSMPVMIPPIGYLLVAASTGGSGTASQREREEGTQAQREYRTHFTGKPHLVASKTTEKLAKQRYPQRVKGQQKVEDSLLAYAEQKRNNNVQRSIELDRVTSRDCTFQPNINTPYMLRFKSTGRGRAVPEHKNVRTMIRRSASRSRAASSGNGPAESLGDTHTDTSHSIESDLVSAGVRGEPPNSSGRRSGQVNTRPEVLGSEGFDTSSGPYLDQKDILGFRSRTNSANNLRRSGSNPRMRPQMEEMPLSAGPPDYVYMDEDDVHNFDESDLNYYPPSGARTAAISAQYRAQNGFVSDPVAARRHTRNAPAPGRFSYSAAAHHAAQQVYSYQNQHHPSQSPRQQNNHGNNNSNYYHDGSQGFPSTRDSPNTMQVPSPRSQAGSALYLAPSPRTASASEYKLTEEALHRKKYKDLYYNF